jgi:hypothetical protein
MRNKTHSKYRFTRVPTELRRARFDNIAIVPASMLPFKEMVQKLLDDLPPGGVFLCHTQANTRQQMVLEWVGETFRQHGHAVRTMSSQQVYTRV